MSLDNDNDLLADCKPENVTKYRLAFEDMIGDLGIFKTLDFFETRSMHIK